MVDFPLTMWYNKWGQVIRLHINSKRVFLTKKECGCLYLLMENSGRVVEYSKFYKKVWEYGTDDIANKKALTRVIEKLRDKLGIEYKDIIKTERKIGYYLKEEVIKKSKSKKIV